MNDENKGKLLLWGIAPIFVGYAMNLLVSLVIFSGSAVLDALYMALILPISLFCLYFCVQIGGKAKKQGITLPTALLLGLGPGAVCLLLVLILRGSTAIINAAAQSYFTPFLGASSALINLVMATFGLTSSSLEIAYVLSLILAFLCFVTGYAKGPLDLGKTAVILPLAIAVCGCLSRTLTSVSLLPQLFEFLSAVLAVAFVAIVVRQICRK